MNDRTPDAFTVWGNFNKDQKKDGHYWAAMEVPLDELRKLVEWAKTADRVQNQKGDDCVKLRANLMPRQSQAGNDYLLMALSDAKPKADKSDVPF
ncbi:hypothetical protein [uncultured Mediterranean phage uvMED]|jgi:hypothetical protein|nr:hypothetical protein [uncultured Mediterranean phage uvMED]BAQ93582.1 hypothetical protein [uncultured Mediterranean phage uvMED]BAR24774.1 hypothetical protein [uncultured Mediterranean phage uvMED]BAR25014.1 hypothetical protein [uncultured Mediterranean phage uvMED]BAR25201.1 hypothetical protein [uncultured Mediterranean phage uvMED]